MNTSYKLLLAVALAWLHVITPTLTGRAGGASLQAQTIGDAFYIYRNDGGFNAFFREEIDSMTYSRYDADSVLYDDVVMQVIYTQDSIYRIPLVAIDSVTFVTPETKYKSEVVRLDPYLPSLQSADGMTLTFDALLNGQHTPRVGDILLYEAFTDQFPTGFAGRIANRTTANGAMTFACDSVCIEEIYDHILCYGTYTAVDNPESEAKGIRFVPLKRIGRSGSISTAIGLNATVGAKGSSLYASADGQIGLDVRVTFKFNAGEKAFFDLSLSPELRVAFEAGAKGKLGGNNALEKKATLLALPIPDTPFFLKFKSGPVVRPQLEASLTAKTEAKLGYRFGLKYEDGKFKGYGSNTSKWFSTPDIEGSVSGSLFVGLTSEVGVYMYGEILSLSLEKEAGVEFEANITANIFNSDSYQELQKAKFDVNLKGSADIKAQAKLFKIFKATTKFNLLNAKYNMLSYKLVPSFSKPVVTVDKSSVRIFVEPMEDVLFPVTVGLGVWDNDGELVRSDFCSATYRLRKNWPSGEFKTSFTGFTPYHNYTVRPLLKLLGGAIVASSEETFMVKITPKTLGVEDVKETSAKVYGKIDEYELLSDNVSYGIGYTTENEAGQTLFDAMEDHGSGIFSVNMEALKPNTTYFYFAYLIVGGEIIKGEIKSFTTNLQLCPDSSHPHLINLGLPSGALWMCCNYGSNDPINSGDYLAWGETNEKSEYTKENYEWHHMDDDGTYVYDDTAFDLAPSVEDVNELERECSKEEKTINDIKGRVYTGPNGNKIFLPYAGVKDSNLHFYGIEDHYWTSTLPSQNESRKNKRNITRSNNDEDEGISHAYDWYDLDWRYLGKNVRQVVH